MQIKFGTTLRQSNVMLKQPWTSDESSIHFSVKLEPFLERVAQELRFRQFQCDIFQAET